jgi:hypothetical protein
MTMSGPYAGSKDPYSGNDPYQQAVDAEAVVEQQFADQWQQHSHATPQTAMYTTQLNDISRQMKQTAANAASVINGLKENDTMAPEGKLRLISEATSAAKAKMAKLEATQRAVEAAVAKDLTAAALPQVDAAREQLARQELLMLLQSSPNPEALLIDLASKGGELAGVAVSSFGESYLRAQGMKPKDAVDAHSLIEVSAVAAAVSSPNPAQAKAAQAYAALPTLSKWSTVVRSSSWNPLVEAGVSR